MTTRSRPLIREPQSLASLIKQCRSLRDLKPVQAHILRAGLHHDIFLTSKLIESAAISLPGNVSHAHLMFSHAYHPPNTFMWNTIIRGYSLTHHDGPLQCISLYHQMLSAGAHPNSYTFAFLLKACCRLLLLSEGRQIHGQIAKMGFDSELPVINGLIRLYVTCGCAEHARQLFDVMPERDSNSWSVMVAGYAQNGFPHEALALFREMQFSAVDIDGFTLASVVGVCGDLGALDLGRWAHSYMDRKGVEMDVVLGNALVDMYGKCGLLDEALRVFQGLDEKDVFLWSTMIGAYAIHGCGLKALQVFSDMIRAKVRPTCVTFTSVLSACGHSGLVDEGLRNFDRMQSEYGIEPQIEHYGCIVDLYCRAGHVREAHEFIRRMPIEPNAVLWRTLLSACKAHGHTKLGAQISKQLLELDPKSSENYVLVSNVYASLGRWSSVSRIRSLMKDRKVKKRHGWSCIEVNFTVHEFVMGDESHRESREIYKMLDKMAIRLREAGYVAATSDVLHDIDEEEKEHALGLHSERLAIAYGLLHTCEGSPIRIVKNLRLEHSVVSSLRNDWCAAPAPMHKNLI
ncbi:hypothetical protein ACLOJK_013116 [Asimina triloba]